MPMSPVRPQMRAPEPTHKSWFRFENATVDENKSDDDKTVIYIYDIIGGGGWFFDGTPANEFIKQLSAVKTPKIELHLNSPGGDIFDGVAIYNSLKSHDAEVTVIVDALAASAASFIAQAGDEIIMTKGSMMMIHDGSAGAYGYASDLRKVAEVIDKLSDNIADIYSDRAGQTKQFWRDLMIEETWYNASEAVDSGLADRQDGEAKEEDVAAQNKWLPYFNFAGRGAAPDPFETRLRIANRLKENIVPTGPNKNDNTDPSGDEKPSEDDKNPSSPEVDEDAKTTSDEEQEKPQPTPGEVPDPPSSDAPENKASGLLVTFKVGDTVHKMTAEQAGARLTVLENFRAESLTQARKDFVEGLATDNKIAATQIDSLTAYALSLDDAGFDVWKATWDNAPSLPMLGKGHGGGAGEGETQSQARNAADSEIETLKGTVTHLKRSGLSNEKIEKTPSYMKLIEIDPDFKL